MSATVERRRVAVGGARTRLLQAGPAGAREAIVFVHGNPRSADDWGALAVPRRPAPACAPSGG